VAGTPLTFSIVSGPAGASINQTTGVITYTPVAADVGTVNITFQTSNALGSVTQTIPFTVAAASSLATPTLQLSGLTGTYNGQYQFVTATAVGSDGVTPVSGTYQIAYNGSAANYPPVFAGTYTVLVTFTSSDPNYGNATALATVTINKATPVFSSLSSPTIAVGAATTTVSGTIGAGVIPAGDYVVITINGVSQDATVATNGTFSISFPTSSLPVGNYTVSYSYAGDANFSAAVNGTSTLSVVPLAVPKVTKNPHSQTVSPGDAVSFTAAATGSPTITVQWQVSTNGGKTWTNVTGNASATTDTLTFYTTSGENGYLYRAVFTNSAGTATSKAAKLTVSD